MTPRRRFVHCSLAAIVAALLAACAGKPPPPDWQVNATGAMDRATGAYLRGETRVAEAEFAHARREIARTGRADLLARAELMRCAAQVASLAFDPCSAFEALRTDAAAPERAYADYLLGHVAAQDVALLPPQHRAVATVRAEEGPAALRGIEDPLSRLVAVGVLFQGGRASPASIELAVETASAQGWRRPLLAWLNVQQALAEKAGQAAEVERLRRRIAVVQGER
jgi:hypothetical protein